MTGVDQVMRASRFRVEVLDLATQKEQGRDVWDAIGSEVSWLVAERMIEHERAIGGVARAINLETSEVVPS